MIAYVHPTSLDERVLSRAVRLLAEGGIVAVPTDTTWGLVCAFRSAAGVKRLKKLAAEKDERSFTLLCAEIAQASAFCALDNSRFRLVKRLSPGPYAFVLRALPGTEKALGLRRREVGIRIPASPVALALIRGLGEPLYSITAKREMADGNGTDAGEADDALPPLPEEALFEGGWELETIDGVDLVLDPGDDLPRRFSTVLDLSGGEPRLLRAGAGPWPA